MLLYPVVWVNQFHHILLLIDHSLLLCVVLEHVQSSTVSYECNQLMAYGLMVILTYASSSHVPRPIPSFLMLHMCNIEMLGQGYTSSTVSRHFSAETKTNLAKPTYLYIGWTT